MGVIPNTKTNNDQNQIAKDKARKECGQKPKTLLKNTHLNREISDRNTNK